MMDVYTDTEYSVTMLAVLAEHRGFVIRKMPLKFGIGGLKMTIDEAISHALEVAESCEWQALQCDVTDAYENHVKGENEQCAADHRQLAEWLTELKEAKRLLKVAVEDFKVIGKALDANCDILINCEECPLQSGHYNCRSWNHQDEALALIGEEGENDEKNI